MAESSGLDWEAIWREQRSRRRPANYAKRTCPRCGHTISESAYSGRCGNFKKHVVACEAKGEAK